MNIKIDNLTIENFKSYSDEQKIDLSCLNIFMGANSSGKSTALQALLALKQTLECNSPDIDFLLSGKYVTLGDFNEVINDADKKDFTVGLGIKKEKETYSNSFEDKIYWCFRKDKMKNGYVCLYQMTFLIDGDEISMILGDNQLYNVYINKKKTQLLARIDNLEITQILVLYDSKFNIEFIEMLNEFLVCLLKKNKVTRITRQKMAALNGTTDFFRYLINESPDSLNISSETNKNVEHVAGKIISLLNEYSKVQYSDFNRLENFYLPHMIKREVLEYFLRNNDLEQINKLIEKYQTKLKHLKDVPQDYTEKENVNMHLILFKEIEKDSTHQIVKMQLAIFTYRSLLENIKKIFYVGPIRERPKGLYNVGFESVPKYVGATGAYFPSVLLSENKIKKFILPNNEMEEITLLEALDEWATHLNVASQVQVKQDNSFGFSVMVSNTQNKKSDIMNVGIGTSQVLPVLITGLLAEENEILIFEQPELHLHPYSQSRLADFFIELVKHGRRIIIETHSEYFVLRLRYHLLKNNISEESIVINFFQNKNGTKVKKGKLNGYGELQYPEDFMDETQKLLDELMNAAMMKE